MKGSATFQGHVRLKKPGEFNRVFLSRQRVQNGYFSLVYAPSSGSDARLGLAIAKKQVRLAVARNRLKRLIRESFRQHRQTLPPVDVVVMARRAATNEPNGILIDALDNLWRGLCREIDNHG